MVARKKVVPPVTPKIVRTSPRQRFIQYGLLLLAFVLTAWFAYEAGKTRVPTDGKTLTTQPQASKQRITELEQERDSLRQQVAELEQSVRQVSQVLAGKRARNQATKQTITTTHKTPAPRPVTTLTESAGYTLGLENIRIEQTEAENVFRIAFSVINDANNNDRVTGTIWIAVNGFMDKQPVRLSFKRLSPDRRSYVKMGFNRQQDIMEEIVLPDNFRPKNILIEAKPYGEKYTGTSEKISWATTND
jgi:cell division protein FtsB